MKFAEPTYQNPPGTLYYPSNSQDSRGQSIVYPGYAPNLNIPLISPYHPELSQQQSQPQSMSSEQVRNILHLFIDKCCDDFFLS